MRKTIIVTTLIVLAVFAAGCSFQAADPTVHMPAKCVFEDENIACLDHAFIDNSIKLMISNENTQALTITQIQATTPNQDSKCDWSGEKTIQADSQASISLTDSQCSFSTEEKTKFDLELTYSIEGKALPENIRGEVLGQGR